MSKEAITRREFVRMTTSIVAGATVVAQAANSLAQEVRRQEKPPGRKADPNRPNILFLFSDQHNARCLSIVGHPDVKTPNLDALAREGVLFTRAFCQNPICTPSRTSFLSGLYPHNHGHFGNNGPEPHMLLSLFSHAKTLGYRTGAFGKIHTPENWIEPHVEVVSDYMQKGNGGYAEYVEKLGLTDRRDDGTFPEYRSLGRPGQPLDARASRMPFEHIKERYYTNRLIEFLRTQPDGQPFCAWLSLSRPHEPYTPAREFWDMYDENRITLPPNADDPLTDKSPQVQARLAQRQPNWPGWIFEPKDWQHGRRRVLRGYYGCVSMVDACFGMVMKELKALGLDENTIVIYSADHGDFAGEHGIIEKAPGLAYDAITRIPFIWRWPGHIPSGKICEELVESVDFLPTVCGLAGLPIPAQCDGYDITPMLKDDNKPVRQAAFTENPWGKRIRKKDWCLAHYPRQMYPGMKEDVGELYDMVNDPWQLKNLYRDPAQRERIADLRRELMDWLITTTHIVTMNPPAATYDPNRKDKKRRQVPQTEGLGEDGRQPWRAIQRAAEAKGWSYL